MSEFLLAAAAAFWLGILTSISPCPLASNIAAVSFIGKDLSSNWKALLSGTGYAFGRTLTYVGLSVVLIGGLLAVPEVSNWLQKYMNLLLGPVLILVGMFLLELLSISLPSMERGVNFAQKTKRYGILGAVALGAVFALSFCPVSAALFFGSLIPLAVNHQSSLVLPVLYGIGTALPVIGFGVVIALGVKNLGVAFKRVTQVEVWVRRITGVVFILVGVWYSVTYVFGL